MSKPQKADTYFDSPERNSLEEILSESKLFKDYSLLQEILDGFSELVLILNKNRQIVAYNSRAKEVFFKYSDEPILGSRFGEALKCIYHTEMEAGCGTSKFCSKCGAAQAIKSSTENKSPAIEECEITTYDGTSIKTLDLRVHSKIIKVKNFEYTLFSIKDIGDEKRRQVLEKIFFHDILNTVGAVNGLANLLAEETDEKEKNELISALVDASDQLIGEIRAQKELRDAEDGNLEIHPQVKSVNQILKTAADIYRNTDLKFKTRLEFDHLQEDVEITTDPVLLVRSLNNLIKNALEASSEGGKVKVSAVQNNSDIIFNIYNNTEIPEDYKFLIFRRSFSTKSEKGRGLGTYSVKLLVEQYLGGKVYFVSDKQSKTIFSIRLPLTLPANIKASSNSIL